MEDKYIKWFVKKKNLNFEKDPPNFVSAKHEVIVKNTAKDNESTSLFYSKIFSLDFIFHYKPVFTKAMFSINRTGNR